MLCFVFNDVIAVVAIAEAKAVVLILITDTDISIIITTDKTRFILLLQSNHI